jgi:hypothetical protein
VPWDVDELVQGYVGTNFGASEAMQARFQIRNCVPERACHCRDGRVIEKRQEGNIGDRRVDRCGERASARDHLDRAPDSALIKRSAIA